MIVELIQNKIIISCFLSWVIIQTIKGLIIGSKKKKFKWEYFFITGHMPSSHSGIVSSLVAAIYIGQGMTSLFMASLIFSLVVIRDSFGSRFLIGEQAKIINRLAKTNLKEVTGHRFKEVVIGAVIGIIISNIIFSF